MTQGTAQLPRPGDMIAGKYVLDRLLGQGGMGAVFAARHLKLSKAVAIKVMLADTSNPEASQRFINEGRAAANIQNEHVVRVDDVDEEMGYAYMVLELLEGRDLAQVLEAEPAKRLPPHVVVGYVLQALKGVMQAHALGIVHRDLKPSNLFLAKRKDGSDVVKVLDFGISKATGNVLGQAPNALTSTKAMLGSPLYMSPEQLRNAKSVDHRADIWAMGVILYELITGALPFMGDNLGELFAAILETDPQPLSQRVPGIAPGLDQVVLRCLARKPEGRFQSVGELAAALAPFERPMPGIPAPMAHAGGTAFLPGGVQTGPQPQRPPGSVQTGPNLPGGAITPPNQFVQTPPAGMGPPQPLGMNLPPPPAMAPGFNTTGSGWQQGAPAVAKSKAPLVALLAFGALALIGIAVIVLVKVGSREESKTTAGTAPTASASATTVATPPPPPTVVASTPPPVASEGAGPSESASAPKPAPTHTTVVAVQTSPHHPPPPPPPPPPTVATQAPPPPKPPVPTTKPGTPQIENAR